DRPRCPPTRPSPTRRSSELTQNTTERAVTSRARIPKMTAEATTLGHKATMTLAIRPRVVSSERTWGEAETISFVSIFTYCLLFRSEEHTSELQSRFDIVCRL